MERVDIYSAVHKMHRARLFELTVAAGRVDPADCAGRAALAGAVDAIVDELHAHAGHEDEFIHPALRRVAPQIARELESAHEELATSMAELEWVAHTSVDTNSDPNTLYRALAAFTARYLDHVAAEENVAMPALWEGCSDEEIGGMLRSFRASRSDVENLAGLLAQIPSLNPYETERMLNVGLGSATRDEIALALATLLEPRVLGAVHGNHRVPLAATS